MKKNKCFLKFVCPIFFLLGFYTVSIGQTSDNNSNTTYAIGNIQNATGGQCNGSITVQVDPPSAFNHLRWGTDGISNTPVISDLCPGEYSISIHEGSTESSCSWILSATVGGEGGCYIQHETWQIEQVSVIECPPPPPGFATEAEVDSEYGVSHWYPGTLRVSSSSGINYIYQWNEISHLGAEAIITDPGVYSIRVRSPNYENCDAGFSITIIDQCDTTSNLESDHLGNKSISPPLIINEFSSGSDQFDEYVELLVQGEYPNCESVDLRNFIIDDNNGDFSPSSENGTSGRGISPGHLRFPNTDKWSNIPIGSLIVIYNEKRKNTKIGLDDPFDNNEDGIYILAAAELNGNEYMPSIYDGKYNTSDIFNQGYWSNVLMFDNNDAIQVRYPDGTYCHGISYGNGNKINGGTQNMKVSNSNGKGKVFFLDGTSPLDAESYTTEETGGRYETPGKPNTSSNVYFIETLCQDKIDIWQAGISKQIRAWLHPNPFKDYLSLNIKAEKYYKAEIVLIDFTGKIVLTQKAEITKGENQYRLNFTENQVISGLYNLRIISEDEILFSQKVVCIK